jgi:hypothetical protein
MIKYQCLACGKTWAEQDLGHGPERGDLRVCGDPFCDGSVIRVVSNVAVQPGQTKKTETRRDCPCQCEYCVCERLD